LPAGLGDSGRRIEHFKTRVQAVVGKHLDDGIGVGPADRPGRTARQQNQHITRSVIVTDWRRHIWP